MKKIVYIGRYLRGGFAPGCRRNVRALLKYTEDLTVAPLFSLPKDHEFEKYVGDVEDDESEFKVVHHLPTTDPTGDAYYSVWEYDRIPENWVDIFNQERTKLIMTESQFCKDVFSKQINDPSKIHVIPYILPQSIINFDYAHSLKQATNIFKNLYQIKSEGGFLFGSIFDWVPRKVPERMIYAFLKEFSTSEPVNLVMRTKINPEMIDLKQKLEEIEVGYYSKYEDALKLERIILLEDRIPKITSFYAILDAYISATAGEGYGQTLCEAMACGLPTIGSAHSGNLDFMKDEAPGFACLVAVEDWSHSTEEGYTEYLWKLPKISSMRKYMRGVYDAYKETPFTRDNATSKKLRRELAPEKIGKNIFNLLKPYMFNLH